MDKEDGEDDVYSEEIQYSILNEEHSFVDKIQISETSYFKNRGFVKKNGLESKSFQNEEQEARLGNIWFSFASKTTVL